MAYESLIENIDLVQGDSSSIWFFGLPDGRSLDDGNWSGRYIIATAHGEVPIVDSPLTLNSGIGEGDIYPPGTRFIFQIIPDHSALLAGNKKYVVAVEISNPSINYRGEIARFTAKVLVGN